MLFLMGGISPPTFKLVKHTDIVKYVFNSEVNFLVSQKTGGAPLNTEAPFSQPHSHGSQAVLLSYSRYNVKVLTFPPLQSQ